MLWNQFSILGVALTGSLVLASCGGGSGSAGTPLLGTKSTMTSSISANPNGTVAPATPVTVTYKLKDRYGNGVANELVLFAVGSNISGQYQCLTTANIQNPGCAATTDGSGSASVILKIAPTVATAIQVTGCLVPTSGVSGPISAASAVAAPFSVQTSFISTP